MCKTYWSRWLARCSSLPLLFEPVDIFDSFYLQQQRFNQMSTSIIGRIDEMGNRIDDLEKSIGDLMQQVLRTFTWVLILTVVCTNPYGNICLIPVKYRFTILMFMRPYSKALLIGSFHISFQAGVDPKGALEDEGK